MFGRIVNNNVHRKDFTLHPPYLVGLDQSEYFWKNGWSDFLEYQVAKQRDPNVILHSQEFDLVLKKDFFAIIKEYKFWPLYLVGKRLWNYLDINPWGEIAAESRMVTNWVTIPFKVFVLLICGVGIWLGLGSTILAVSLSSFMLAAPTFLVNSSFVKYNIAGQFALVLLFVASIVKIFEFYFNKE